MNLEIIEREPPEPSKSSPILFIHGMWHAAWCWEVHFLPYFAEHGYRSYALSLRGHGTSEGRERIRWTSIADYVEDVARTVERMDRPPVLVGHSMGGMVVQKYLETHKAPAAVLLAATPPRGVMPTVFRVIRRCPGAFLKANLTLSMLPIISSPGLVRDALFSDGLSEELVHEYGSKLQDDSYRAFLDMLGLNSPKPDRIDTPPTHIGRRRRHHAQPRADRVHGPGVRHPCGILRRRSARHDARTRMA